MGKRRPGDVQRTVEEADMTNMTRGGGRWRVGTAGRVAAWALGLLLADVALAEASAGRLPCEDDSMLTREEILQMLADDQPQQDIIAAIRQANVVDFAREEMDFADVLEFVRAGVPDAILQAMSEWRLDERSRFRDCEECGCLVVVPAEPDGFLMGSPEGPRHEVTIARPFAVGIHEVTRGEFRRFVEATSRDAEDDCEIWFGEDRSYKTVADRRWDGPGFDQDEDHPVVCVSWHDAQAYVDWLSSRTKQHYWLLSEAQWEYVARAATTTARYWGESADDQCDYANGGDEGSGWTTANSCDDGYHATSPAGHYLPNVFRLHDVLGNVWEWVDDCYHDSYDRAPQDGTAAPGPDDCRRVSHGGGFNSSPGLVRSAQRRPLDAGLRRYNLGFRVGRTIETIE